MCLIPLQQGLASFDLPVQFHLDLHFQCIYHWLNNISHIKRSSVQLSPILFVHIGPSFFVNSFSHILFGGEKAEKH